jgi:4-amino-4-deoxy-L-arabinose transferase-like glycosyltransferase
MIKNKTLPLILILFFLALILRLLLVFQGVFSFSWDFGRDLLWVRQLTIQHKPILVGPWGSLDGTFFGPLYYYFLALVFFIFGSDPKIAAAMISFFLSSMIIIGYWFGKKALDKTSGALFALLFSILAIFSRLSLYAFSQNLVPFFWLIFTISQWQLLKRPTGKKILLTSLLASLFFHFEPVDFPAAVIITMGIIFYLWKNRKIKKLFSNLAIAGLGFILPLIPNIIFDIRHGFNQLKAYRRFFSGHDESLHGKLPFLTRLLMRPKEFLLKFSRTFLADGHFLTISLVIILAFFTFLLIKRKKILIALKKRKSYSLFLSLIVWNITCLFLYFIIFSRLLKGYYLYMLPVLFVFIAGSLTTLFLQEKIVNQKVVLVVFLLLALINIFTFVKGTYQRIEDQTYSVQKTIVDTIYQGSQKKPFKVYIYTPLIYDYPYQYLFSWYGNKTYGYIPVDYAYLPDQPEYVLNKNFFDQGKSTNRERGEAINNIFLIIEPEENNIYSQNEWLNNFPIKTVVYQKEFPGEISLLKVELKTP